MYARIIDCNFARARDIACIKQSSNGTGGGVLDKLFLRLSLFIFFLIVALR